MREQIRVMGMQLNVGDSKRFHCPFCLATHEKSLAITRTPAGLLYICFRAKCNTQGIVGDVRMEPIKNKVFVPQIITEPLVTLPEDIYNKYLAQYSLDYQDWNILHHVKFAPESNSLYFPMYNPWGALIGAQLKRLDNHTPKVLTFRYAEEPLVHFPLDVLKEYVELVVVEDFISAAVVHEVAPVCSINGTNITKDMLKLFKIIGVKNLILMLDGDAVAKAATIKKAIGPLFKSCRIIPLPTGTDPKDFSYRELEKLIYI